MVLAILALEVLGFIALVVWVGKSKAKYRKWCEAIDALLEKELADVSAK